MTTSSPQGAQTLTGLSGTIVLVGAGKMGGAISEGWLGLGLDPKKIVVVEPQPGPEITALAARGLRINTNDGAAVKLSSVLFAVKPQFAADVLPTLKPYVGASTVAVSIMAGRTLGFLEQ